MCALATALVLAVAVQGTVTLQGKPAAGARVEASRDRFFHPGAKRAVVFTNSKGAFHIDLPEKPVLEWWLRADYQAAGEGGAFAALESAPFAVPSPPAPPAREAGKGVARPAPAGKSVPPPPPVALALDRAEGRPATFAELDAAASGKPAQLPWRDALAHALKLGDPRAARNAEEVFAYAVRTAESRDFARLAAREAAEAAQVLCALAGDATSCLVGISTLVEIAGPVAVGRVREARAALTADPREAARLYGEAVELHRRAGDAYRQAEALAGREHALLRAAAGADAAPEAAQAAEDARREALLRSEVEDACGEGAALALAGRAGGGAKREAFLREGLKRLKRCAGIDDALGVAHTEELLLAAGALGDRAEMEEAAEIATRSEGAHLAAAHVYEALGRWAEAAERYRRAGLGDDSKRDLLRALVHLGAEEAVTLARELRDPAAEGEALAAWARTLLDAGKSEEARKALLDAGLAYDAAERPRDADAVRRLYPQLEAARGDRLCAEGRHAEEADARKAAAFHFRKVGEFASQGEQLLLRVVALFDAGDVLGAEPAAQETEAVYGAPGVRAGWEERLRKARADPAPEAREREKAIQRDEPRRRLAQVLFWKAAAREQNGRTTAAADLEDAARRLESAGEAEGAQRAYHRAAVAYAHAGPARDDARAQACRAKAAADPAPLQAVAEADKALVAGDPAATLAALARASGARPARTAEPDGDPPWLEVARKEWPRAARERRVQRLAEMADVLEAAGDAGAKDALSALAKLHAQSRAPAEVSAAAAAAARAASPRASPAAPLLLALASRRAAAWEPASKERIERLPPFLYEPPPGDAAGAALRALLDSLHALSDGEASREPDRQ